MLTKYLKLFLFLLSILTTNIWVSCIEESFCAGTGFLDGYGKSKGVKSLGWTKFEKEPYGRVLGANHINSDASYIPELLMDIQKVEEPERGQNSDLNGWLQLKIKTRDGFGLKFLVITVWAITDTRESIGEFVSPKAAQCASIPKLTYTDENIVPCAAAPVNEPTNPNMFVFVDTEKRGGFKELNLLWRTSVSYCNFPKKFRFMIAVNTQWFQNDPKYFKLTDRKYGPRIYASKWISPKFYGPAAAPLFDSKKLKCSTSIKDSQPQWIKSISSSTAPTDGGRELVEVEQEYTADRWYGDAYYPTENHRVVDSRRGCKPKSGTYAFAGRCTTNVGPKGAKDVSAMALHKCEKNNNFDASDLSVLQGTYDDYLTKREKTLNANCDCPPVPTAEEVRELLGGFGRKRRWIDAYHGDEEDEINDDDDEESIERAGIINEGNEIDPPERPYSEKQLSKCEPAGVKNGSYTKDEQGLCIHSMAGKIVYGVRQWHAVSILFGIVVLSPVTTYMARYLKGTFSLTGGNPIPIKRWYIVHISLVLPLVCMGTTGMSAIYRQRQVLGYSYTDFARYHRIYGHCMFLIGLVEVISGVVRPQKRVLRKFVIAIHWFGGVLIKYLGLALCILTYRIPASPTAFVSHLDSKRFERIWTHMAPTILVVWGVVDVLFQIFMTLHVIIFDRKFAIKRSHFPIIIPIMLDNQLSRINEEFEKEKSFQEGAFTMYVVLAFLTYLLTCIAIYNFNNTSNEQSFGPMFCSHNEDGKFRDPNVKPMVYGYC